MYNWVTLLHGTHWHKIMNQLYFSKKTGCGKKLRITIEFLYIVLSKESKSLGLEKLNAKCISYMRVSVLYTCLRKCQVASVVSNSLWPYGLGPPGSSVHRILQARVLEWLPFPPPVDLSDLWSNMHLQHWHTESLLLRHLGSPIFYSRFILK